jgi:uncharacterized membrane protein
MVHLMIRRVFPIFYLTILGSIVVLGQNSLNVLNIVYKHDY